MPRLNQTSKFIQKLRSILDNPEQDSIIGWNQSGESFQILNPAAFQQHILPRYFRHAKLKSFVRQLNMYGFKKARNCGGILVFRNASFNRHQNSHQHTIQRITLKNKQIPKNQETKNTSLGKIRNHEVQYVIEKDHQNIYGQEQNWSPLPYRKPKSNCKLEHNFHQILPISLYSFTSNPNHCPEEEDSIGVGIDENKAQKTSEDMPEEEQSAAQL